MLRAALVGSLLAWCPAAFAADAADPAPRQIHLAVAGSNGMRVAWKTNTLPSSAAVEFATDLSKESATVAKVERSVQYLEEGKYGYHHSATLSGLTAGASYQYRVVSDGVSSSVRSFKVSKKEQDATFLVVGDMGYGMNGEAVQTRDRMELLKGSVDAVLHVGDISYADDSFLHGACTVEFCYEATYDSYMDWMENITDNMPYMVAVGNHETECHSPACLLSSSLRNGLKNFSAYNARWAMPSQESGGTANMWYSFDYGLVHFVVLNTETDFKGAPEENYGSFVHLPSGHFAPDGEYLRWLEADLKAADANRAERPYVITMGHRPWYARAGVFQKEEQAVYDAHAALLERYHVDLHLAGHIHSYHRLLPLGNNTATPLIVTGGAGCDEFSIDRKSLGPFDEAGKSDLWDYRNFNSDKQVGILKATSSMLTFTAISSTTGATLDTVHLPRKAEAQVIV